MIEDRSLIGLYIHFPWCIRKCPYCDFNSYHSPDSIDYGQYISSLIQDLKKERLRVQPGQVINSIFLGGGTPSLFPAKFVAQLLEAIHKYFNVAKDCEITLEANPGTTEQDHFHGYIQAGINRLSLGIQSFADTALKKLGRIHSSTDAATAVLHAQAAGFSNINIDLMYALPEQTAAAAVHDLETAIALNPTHISWYQLTIEPNTQFYRRPPATPPEATVIDIEEQGYAILSTAGFSRYEISAYARTGQKCKHNLNYWQFGDYIGVGAGAHGKLTNQTSKQITRTAKYKTPIKYLQANGRPVTQHILSRQDKIVEFMLNSLRLLQGFSWCQLEVATGLTRAELSKPLLQAKKLGLLQLSDTNCQATPLGVRFLNDLIMIFETEAEKYH